MSNLNAYGVSSSKNSSERGIGTVQPVRNIETTQPQSENTGVGRVIRRVFTPSERNSYTPPANTSRREVRRNNNSNNRRSYYNNNNNERRTYNNDNNQSRNNTYEAPQRTYTPSTPSNSSSSSSGSGSSSAPVRTFRRQRQNKI